MQAGPGADYFVTRKWSFEWTFGDHTALMSFWHGPLHAMTDAFTAAGFWIAVSSEPPHTPSAARTGSAVSTFHMRTCADESQDQR
jgi:hypothetical protein